MPFSAFVALQIFKEQVAEDFIDTYGEADIAETMSTGASHSSE